MVPDSLYDAWISSTNWSASGVVEHIVKYSDTQPLTFTAKQDNSSVRIARTSSSAPALSLEYSTDGGSTWSDYTISNTISLNYDDSVKFRAKTTNTAMGSSEYNYNHFVLSGEIEASGNINFLLSRNGVLSGNLPNYCFYKTFYGCSALTTVPSLHYNGPIPQGGYREMFRGCSSIHAGPSILPSSNVGERGYEGMFQECTNLQTAPSLPATTLGSECYGDMFYGCTSLTTAPSLPATTLANSCYMSMFDSCTGLTKAPRLPATTLSNGCYSNMFSGCTSLNTITIDYVGNFSNTYFDNWVNGVANSGTFIYNGSDTTRGVSAIPSGWTIQPLTLVDYINVNRADFDTGVAANDNIRVVGGFRGNSVGNRFLGTSD